MQQREIGRCVHSRLSLTATVVTVGQGLLNLEEQRNHPQRELLKLSDVLTNILKDRGSKSCRHVPLP